MRAEADADCCYALLCVVIQPAKAIVEQAKLHASIPVHTISFNCDDVDANRFLHELARETGARFHYYSRTGCQPDADAPPPRHVRTSTYTHRLLVA